MNYRNDVCWRNVQQYLPPKNRFTSHNLPEEYFITLQDIKIHIDHYKVKNPKARIVLFHGVGGNGRLLSFIALPLMKNGFEVICPDLPLYGYTQYEGIMTYDTWVSCGVEIVNNFREDTLPIFLFGLSAGGMLAYQVANSCPDIKGIMTTCILDQRNRYITKQTAANPYMATVGNALISFTKGVTGSFRVPMKWIANMKMITNNEDLAVLLMKDKRSSGASVPLSFVHSMLNPVIQIEPENFTQCPFLLAHPEDDRWTDISLSRLFFDRLACDKELKILEGAGHFPVEEKGLNQLERKCVDFMERYLSENKRKPPI